MIEAHPFDFGFHWEDCFLSYLSRGISNYFHVVWMQWRTQDFWRAWADLILKNAVAAFTKFGSLWWWIWTAAASCGSSPFEFVWVPWLPPGTCLWTMAILVPNTPNSSQFSPHTYCFGGRGAWAAARAYPWVGPPLSVIYVPRWYFDVVL